MRKFLIASLAMILALGMMGGAFAYFTDVETSIDNTFTAGTLDLKIVGAGGWGDVGPVGQWTMSNMAPGVNTDWGRADLRHQGTVPAHHLEVGCDYTATEGPPTGDMDNVVTTGSAGDAAADDFAKFVEITSFDYHNGSWHLTWDGTSYSWVDVPEPTGWLAANWQIDPHGDGIVSLYDLYLDPLDNLPPPDSGAVGDVSFEMTFKFHEDAGNDLQGDTLDATVTFTLNQDVSQ